ncbi:glycerol dehydrogenase [uncultured Thiodictyon sp.]|uniref:glycerol dehydrogenase n=1 Tax=uncultured Thiodictyon sp. TaxID=1846217 RepID=UPI002600BEB2|nr:glycerol dehydrogenase [uncultured Thiodictyon sp.]
MSAPLPYLPQRVFAAEDGTHGIVPQALIAPPRYVQGPNVWERLGRYLSLIPSTNAAILISAGGQRRDGARLLQSIRSAQIAATTVTFHGECSQEEVERVVAVLRASTPAVDCVVAVGGGKCIDAGKCVADRLGVPVVVCPSLASNDAPCSALSVMYSPAGVFADVEYFPHSPALVVVDTQVIAAAPVRYLVAGMGDAMATWYEARTCLRNPQARSVLGARPTLAASALGELCARTLFADGVAALEAVQRGEVTDALERIVETNTLLSGIGFESGGLALAHAVAQGLTVLPAVHQHYLHGEMVAMGLLTQLVVQSQADEFQQVAAFFATIGLPVHLGQLGLDPDDTPALRAVMETAMTLPYIVNEPLPLSVDTLVAAARHAHTLGNDVAQRAGDAPYRALHSE